MATQSAQFSSHKASHGCSLLDRKKNLRTRARGPTGGPGRERGYLGQILDLIDPVLCGRCGRHVLDLQGKHVLCCVGSGHSRVRDPIAMGLAMADAGTVTEPLGLVPSAPNLRPADILTRASTVDGCDVGIASPEASGAGLDSVESMRVRQLEHTGERVPMELEEQNVLYTPLVLSCYGRRSSILTSLLRAAAQQAARTRDASTAESLVWRWELVVVVQVWRRTAMMVRRCLPRPGEVDQTRLGQVCSMRVMRLLTRSWALCGRRVLSRTFFISGRKRVRVRVRVRVKVRE